MSAILRLHNLTAIASDSRRNLGFSGGLLGLRLINRTDDRDDSPTYHLCNRDAVGVPGSIETIFSWPGARRGRSEPRQAAAEPPARLLAEVAARLRHVCSAMPDGVFAATVYDVAAFKWRWTAPFPR